MAAEQLVAITDRVCAGCREAILVALEILPRLDAGDAAAVRGALVSAVLAGFAPKPPRRCPPLPESTRMVAVLEACGAWIFAGAVRLTIADGRPVDLPMCWSIACRFARVGFRGRGQIAQTAPRRSA